MALAVTSATAPHACRIAAGPLVDAAERVATAPLSCTIAAASSSWPTVGSACTAFPPDEDLCDATLHAGEQNLELGLCDT